MEVITGDKLRSSQINEDKLNLYNKLVGKKTVVTTNNGDKYSGLVKTIDPVSGSIVLFEYESNPPVVTNVKVITGHSVDEVTIDADQSCLPELSANIIYKKDEKKDEDDVQNRKVRLIAWFKKHLLPVKEADNDNIIVASIITVKPPYYRDDVSCKNVTAIRRIQDLISRMPTSESADEPGEVI